MTHWQHKALTSDAIHSARDLAQDGLPPKFVKFMQWARENKHPLITAGVVVREYFHADMSKDSPRFPEAKALLEALALNGYLLRGRTRPLKANTNDTFKITHYRLSPKAKRLLARHDAAGS
jgi:hypothetical protein